MATKKRLNNNLKINIILVTIIIILISLFFTINNNNKKCSKKINTSAEVEFKENSNDNLQRKFKQNENIVILGDSITEIYPIDEIYDNYQIIRSGKSGYKTTTLLENMADMLYKYNPTKVIILIGTNDIAHDKSEEKQRETVNNIKKISEEIKKNRPNTKIYIESIYPVNRNMSVDVVNERTNDAIKSINRQVKKYCDEKKITYINVYDELTNDNGDFDEKYTYDGLHPSTLGYAKITKVLIPYIYE